MRDHTVRVPGTLMRGGSSKCWLFERTEMPENRDDIAEALIDIYGAEDPHQLDGVGGGSSVTSKAVIVSDSLEEGIDVDYLFAQVGVGAHRVEWGSNCGNCATAVALYAARTRPTLSVVDGPVTVRMRNVNTGSLVTAVVHPEGEVATVPGVLGEGNAVDLAFTFSREQLLAQVWPTFSPIDELPGDAGAVAATLCSAGAPIAVASAERFGVSSAASIGELEEQVPRLRRLRANAAVRMGLAHTEDEAADAVPKVGLIAPAVDYVTELGDRVGAVDYDVSVRMLSMNAPHPTIGLTTAVALAVAATRPGTLLERVGVPVAPAVLRIGTPGGVVSCAIRPAADGSLTVLLHRAARHLADALLVTRRRIAETA